MQTVYIQLKRFVTQTISSDSTQLLFGSRFWTDIPICNNERVQIRRLLHCRNSGMKGLTIDPSYPTISHSKAAFLLQFLTLSVLFPAGTTFTQRHINVDAASWRWLVVCSVFDQMQFSIVISYNKDILSGALLVDVGELCTVPSEWNTCPSSRKYTYIILSPLKSHFYIVKLGIHYFFLFLLKNIDCLYSLEPPRRDGSNASARRF